MPEKLHALRTTTSTTTKFYTRSIDKKTIMSLPTLPSRKKKSAAAESPGFMASTKSSRHMVPTTWREHIPERERPARRRSTNGTYVLPPIDDNANRILSAAMASSHREKMQATREWKLPKIVGGTATARVFTTAKHKHTNGRSYTIRTGPRGGRHIVVEGKKIYFESK